MAYEILVSNVEPPGDREQRFQKDRLRIGRCRDNDLTFEGSTKLSRYHAEIFVADGKLRVRDLGSRNGTWVNDKRIPKETTVESADVLRLGDGGPAIRVSLVDPAAPLAAAKRAGPETTLLEKLDPAPAARAATPKRPSERATAPAAEAKPAPRPAVVVSPKPASEAKPAVVVSPKPAMATVTPANPKDAIGPETLALAIDAIQAQHRSKTQKVIAIVVGGVVLVLLVVLGWVATISSRSSADSERYREELAALREKVESGEARAADLETQIRDRDAALEQVKKQQGLSETERAELVKRTEGELASLKTELKKSQEAAGASAHVWADLVDRYKESVFLCVTRTRDGIGFGTAFAVRENGVLATNAHVVEMFKGGAENFVIQNGTGHVFTMVDKASNPNFKGVSSPDVGLLRIETEGKTLVPFPLADDAALKKLRIGTQLGTLGYPGELGATYLQNFDPRSKAFRSAGATYKDGSISQITNYKGEVADFASSMRIQHSASLTGGTSGSPMFTADGMVVALNNSSLDIMTPRGGNQGQIRQKSAAQIGYAIRVDELRRFLLNTGW
jgi:pSer/pThr/pTyr-binding forkhead associated (FHA) protein/S1-C subfamily serine protease